MKLIPTRFQINFWVINNFDIINLMLKNLTSVQNCSISTFKQDVIDEINRVIKLKNNCNILITGGRSLFENVQFILKNLSITKNSNLNFWLTDERIQMDTSHRNDAQILNNLKLNVEDFNFFNWNIYNPNISEVEISLDNMRKQLLNFLHDGLFDVAILSVGEDGHIGANWKTQKPFFEDENFVYHDSIENKYPNRIGFSIKRIKKSNKTFIYVNDEKKEYLIKLMDNQNTPYLYNFSELGSNIRLYLKMKVN